MPPLFVLHVLASFDAQKKHFQKQAFTATLTLNVARTGIVSAEEYAFDDFYRLQADERFADTVVRWLQSPRIVTDIYDQANIDTSAWSQRKLSTEITARRLSSQVIDVSFQSSTTAQGSTVAEAIKQELNEQTAQLNQQQNKQAWFVLLGDDPVVSSSAKPFLPVMLFSILIGFFIAFWATLVRHYMKN